MVGVVEGFSWSIHGNPESPGALVLVSTVVVLTLLVGGMFYFRRMEQHFADTV
jgi:lipopolysaccharide transport system permease protein